MSYWYCMWLAWAITVGLFAYYNARKGDQQ